MAGGPPNNVTPFNPRKRPLGKVGAAGGPGNAPRLWDDPRMLVILVYGAAAAAFALSFISDSYWLGLLALCVGFAALAIAAARRTSAPELWARSHHEFILRTILIGGAVWIVAALLRTLPGIGPLFAWLVILIHLCIGLWVAVRAMAGVLRAVGRRPVTNPRTLWL